VRGMSEASTASFDVAFVVNGSAIREQVAPRTTLVDFLRQRLGLTGSHVGCEHGVCGACTVLLDGVSVRSCLTLAVQAEGAEVTTVEGLEWGPLQEAFRRHHALQCGFCTPGMLLTAQDLLARKPGASSQEIREALSGNYCRCTGYHAIVEAVRKTAESRGRT